jgi:hypothetical protein
MKRIIIMLLIVSSAITTISADPSAAPKKKPESVINTLNAIIQKFGQNEGQVYSVNRNPNTGIIESSTKIVPFHCKANHMQNDNVLNAVAINFPKDEPMAYQFLHVQPGSNEMFSLKVITNNGSNQSTQRIRTNRNQEMWFMCCKNPENPQLRDAYAIVWERTDEIDGTIYMITSLRPDIYTKNLETSKNTFKIEGRVDANIKDSLYNIYIAESAEALEAIGDDDYVACVPVVNKRFEFQTELDRPMVGRLRCIFPDGELCSAWINLDFVPGETYRITVHNGYYDEDRDYERRVGRYSGKSLLNDRQKRGIDDVVPKDLGKDATYIGPVEVEEDTEEAEYIKASPSNNLWEPSPAQRMQFVAKGTAIEAKMKSVKAMYQSLDPKNNASWMRKDLIFDQINKQNKEVDAAFHDLLKFIKTFEIPADQKAEFYGGGYKPMMDFYTEQNKALTEMISSGIQLPKSAQKTQKALNKYIEKYMTEMTKLMSEMK